MVEKGEKNEITGEVREDTHLVITRKHFFSLCWAMKFFGGIFQFMLGDDDNGDDDDLLLADVAHTLARPPLTLFHLTAFCFMCQRIRTLPLIMVSVWSLNLSKIIFGVKKHRKNCECCPVSQLIVR